jgi:hypothetical protein
LDGPSAVPAATLIAHDDQQGPTLMQNVRFLSHPMLAGPTLQSDPVDAGCAGPAAPLRAPLEMSGIEIPIDMTERFRTLGNLVAFLRGPVPRAAR